MWLLSKQIQIHKGKEVIQMIKWAIRLALVASGLLLVFLFRKTIKRMYEAMVKPIVTKSITAFRVGL